MPLPAKDLGKLLSEAKTITFCSHNNDGTIHAVPVYFRYQNGKIYTMMHKNSRKMRNIARNNQISASVMTPPTEKCTSKIALIYGGAKTEEILGNELFYYCSWLNEKYLPKPQAEALLRKRDLTGWRKVTIIPDRIISFYPEDYCAQVIA